MPESQSQDAIMTWDRDGTEQFMLTGAIPFAADHADAVDLQLERCVPQLRSKGRIREALRHQGFHFLTITVVRDSLPRPAHLLFELSADGHDEAEIWERLATLLAPWLQPILEAADISLSSPAGEALARHSIRIGSGLLGAAGIVFRGTPEMTASRIRNEYLLAREIRSYFDANTSLSLPPLETLEDLRRHIGTREHLRPLLKPTALPMQEPPDHPRTTAMMVAMGVLTFLWPLLLALAVVILVTAGLSWHTYGLGAAVLALLAGLFATVLIVVAVALWLWHGLSCLEGENTPDDSLPDDGVLSEVIAYENWSVQNHLAGISVMQAGYLRRLTLRLAFWVIGQMVTWRFRPGFLGELGTIHFARWVLLPGTNKLLFFSNYGGSWESYLEDFITRAAPGLTAVWSNTSGFPRTRNLFSEGATDGDRFKRWARRQQQPTRFWYSAYPHLTTARIRTNARLRYGLNEATTPEKARLWLARSGAQPPAAGLLETAEIQTLLFGGLGNHPHFACLVLRLPGTDAAARGWLRLVLPQITFGDQPSRQEASVLAFAASGLERLGLSGTARAEFPKAYRMGMADPARANILSDTGEDGPSSWLWGGEQDEADAVLLVYSETAAALEAAVAARGQELMQVGGQILHRVTADPLPVRPAEGGPRPAVKEPFGYVDGISQPIIRGTRRWMRQEDAIHHVEPGEFLFGYPDGRGYFPLSPTLDQSADPEGLLAAIPHELTPASPLRDFGRNGSFLVIRQLEQDVATFNSFITGAAQQLENHPALPPAIASQEAREAWIGAKMVGRWKDGRSLVRYPHHPPAAGSPPPDNSFLYGAEDPVGERCPFGAHIRRSNPRDSKVPQSAEEIAISNRHRILRVGRSFSAGGSGDEAATRPGLLFMCLNVDIERQFEFIQQTWAMAGQFHGLENEVDPLIVRGVGEDGEPRLMARLTIPTPQGPLHLTGIRDFVRTRGGGYFFLPGRQALQYLSRIQEAPND